MRINWLMLFVFGLLALPVQADVHEFILDNGMKVLVKPDHRAPVVVSQVWYKVGSAYEYDGITGVSHALEHAMFKGTEAHPAGEFSEIIAANGGDENAFTGRDYTAYFQHIASDRLELCLRLEADRMRNLLLEEEEFLKEIEVIKEERRLRTDDRPTALTFEKFNAVAYLNSPYGQPVIGWMSDLDAMTIEDLRRWYRTWYAPNNAILVVVGDVDPKDVLRTAKKYFGDLETSEIPSLKPRKEVEHRGKRRIQVKAPAELPYLIMGYKVPVLLTAEDESEVYALEVLAWLLDGGNSARLTNNLVRGQQIAAGVGAGYSLYDSQGSLFVLSGTPAKGVAVEALEKALKEQISSILTNPPTQSELNRVKAQVVASAIYQEDSLYYQAMEIGSLETIGIGWRKKDEYVKKIQEVTAGQVKEVAEKYLQDERLTVAELVPLPITEPPKPPKGEMRHDIR